jgi:GntR family transcriptional regulator
LHAQIRERLREMVAQGLFDANDRLPAESELARALGVSRMTIRQAITPLVAEGLLNRVHGRGTYVAHPKLEASLARLLSFSEEMAVRGQSVTTSLLLAREEKPEEEVASALGLQPEDRVVHLERLRLVDGEPTSLQNHYLPLRVVPTLLVDVSGDFYSLYEYLESHQVRLARAWQRLSAGIATARVVRFLDARRGSAVLIQQRVAMTPDNSPVEFSRVVYRADRYACYVELVR